MRSRRPRQALLAAIVLTPLAIVALPPSAPASIEEQRKRLPPPAKGCPDAIEGVWVCIDNPRGDWYRHALHIEREAPSSIQLTGKIQTRSWSGPRHDPAYPESCEGGASDYEVRQPSTGTFVDGRVSFGAQSYIISTIRCGFGPSNYHPDTFTGQLLDDGTEFHSVHDDGYHEPRVRVFRRIQCMDPKKPTPTLPPPAPPPVGTGCSCF